MAKPTTAPQVETEAIYPDGMSQEEYEEALLCQAELFAALLIRLCPEFFVVEEAEAAA